jgi:HSP20 family protein
MMLDLVPFDPMSTLRDIDRLLERSTSSRSRWLPRVDVFDREAELVVRVEMAGVDPDAIDVTVEDRTLTIAGSRHFEETTEENGFHHREIFVGDFKRTLMLPEGLDASEISARADNGILQVVIPRKPEVLPRKVKIDVSG